MHPIIYKTIIILCFILYQDLCGQPTSPECYLGDKTSDLVLLGNMPERENIEGRALNIWDLQVFEGKIFMGYGSTIENTGPTKLYSFNPEKNVFVYEANLKAEAIEKLRVINDTLLIPNSDPRSGDYIKYRYYKNGQSRRVSLKYKLAHVRDIHYYNGHYYLFGNTRCMGEKSRDCGGIIRQRSLGPDYESDFLTTELSRAGPLVNARWNWFFGAFELDDKLIIPNAMFTKTYHPDLVIKDNMYFIIEDDSVQWSAYQPDSVRLRHTHFYSVDTSVVTIDTAGVYTSLRPFESFQSNGSLLFTLRTYSMTNKYYRSAYNNSVGLLYKDCLYCEALQVTFPDSEAVGEDLLRIDDALYALANKTSASGQTTVYVYLTYSPDATPDVWEEVLHFSASCIARSFEYYNGSFYFGLGHNNGGNIGDSGMLATIKITEQ